MGTTLLISKIIGLIYLSFGIGLLFNRKYYLKVFTQLLENTSFMIFAGFLAIIIGVLIIEYHAVLDTPLAIIISVIGYIALFKGALILAFPATLNTFKTILKSEKLIIILGPFVLLFGIIFCYFGFLT